MYLLKPLIFIFLVDCSMSCPEGNLNADCTFCVCASKLFAYVVTTTSRPIIEANVTHSNAPGVVLNSTSLNGSLVVENICYGDEFVLQSDGFEDLKFAFIDFPGRELRMRSIGRKLSQIWYFKFGLIISFQHFQSNCTFQGTLRINTQCLVKM